MRRLATSLWPIAWVLPALVAFVLADRALDAAYGAHLGGGSTKKGREQRDEIRSNDAGIVVIGDSSGRYGVNARMISEATGIPAWNLASFLDAMPGHVSLLIDELRRGRELKAVIIASTEQLAERRATRVKPAMRQYYVSPSAIRLWIEHEGFDLEETLDFTAAWLSPTFRAGQGLQKWLLSLWDLAKEEGLGAVATTLTKQRQASAAWQAAYRETLGQTVAPSRGRPEKQLRADEKHLERYLFRHKAPWKLHPSMAGWYESLLEECERHGVVVVQAFAPRTSRFLEHKRWKGQYGEPIRRFGEDTARRYQSFVLAYPDGFEVDREELWNTASHVGPKAADRFTAGILAVLAPRLGLALPADVEALAATASRPALPEGPVPPRAAEEAR